MSIDSKGSGGIKQWTQSPKAHESSSLFVHSPSLTVVRISVISKSLLLREKKRLSLLLRCGRSKIVNICLIILKEVKKIEDKQARKINISKIF